MAARNLASAASSLWLRQSFAVDDVSPIQALQFRVRYDDAVVAYLVDPAGEFGWSRSVVGLALSLQWIFSGVFGPPAGWLGDRYGLRRTMAVGALLFLAASVLIGLVTAPWQFILYFGILMSAALSIFQVPLVSAVTLWFYKHLGVAMGLLQSAQGLGNVLFAPLMVVLLTQLGWRWAFWGPGLVGGLILLLLARFFYNEPAEMGLRPLGAAPGSSQVDCLVFWFLFLRRGAASIGSTCATFRMK